MKLTTQVAVAVLVGCVAGVAIVQFTSANRANTREERRPKEGLAASESPVPGIVIEPSVLCQEEPRSILNTTEGPPISDQATDVEEWEVEYIVGAQSMSADQYASEVARQREQEAEGKGAQGVRSTRIDLPGKLPDRPRRSPFLRFDLQSRDPKRRRAAEALAELEQRQEEAYQAQLDARARGLLSPTHVREDFGHLDGKAIIIADDGTFLGRTSSNEFDEKSILNEFGTHGSEFSSESIFNEFGRYGGRYSQLSPWNDVASTPPRIFRDEEFVGFLTVNRLKIPQINPHALVGFLKARN